MSQSASTALQMINDTYVQACRELTSAYGVTIDLQNQPGATLAPSKATCVSVLGANGEGVQLLSTLTVDVQLLARMHPVGQHDVSVAELEDWCRELNNQLVGRVKNKLLSHGFDLMIGLPALIRGTDISTV